ncbi:3-oxo-5-alpha-steroid 4-dehydrogenase 2a [Chanos chanos]|uniref:3-oxo-5alpha-steroid 4-dehydrogenase (NADP(+)) n=1 Tax=Chanos chanos TaxID=29144 RepID=A0A6J2VX20_CHACN|nr:3-oxo-5-alpha-steroid 4-dehydrogenase 2-like [Chanos chanos]
MHCQENTVNYVCWLFIIGGVAFFFRQMRTCTPYGRYVTSESHEEIMVPAKAAWFIQELPSFLVPALLFVFTDNSAGIGRHFLIWMFCLHYFQRTFIYSLLTQGRPSPLRIVVFAAMFCSLNGWLQGHYILHCVKYDDSWWRDIRPFTGLVMFFSGMAINIHSDHILRNLRKPGEIAYKIPKGGMFELVSGANYFGEILEWCGYAVATWSFSAVSFAFFTICSIGPRAFHHHRYYINKFDDYPKSRKAVIPFVF